MEGQTQEATCRGLDRSWDARGERAYRADASGPDAQRWLLRAPMRSVAKDKDKGVTCTDTRAKCNSPP